MAPCTVGRKVLASSGIVVLCVATASHSGQLGVAPAADSGTALIGNPRNGGRTGWPKQEQGPRASRPMPRQTRHFREIGAARAALRAFPSRLFQFICYSSVYTWYA